jgi:LmbE family N-acetylglucosaminyl deacetylase
MRYLFILFLGFWPLINHSQPYRQLNSAEIKNELHRISTPARVLYVAAHPDDENTRLLAWLVNEKKCTAAYLSLTRGDGGQNLIGTEKAELLGIIRTEELLAARRVDGAGQFFTRAVDFGYSKNPEETFEKWGKEAVLADVVFVIRKFRPDIIITRFPTTGEGGHGHHTASAILAEEAFSAAADPQRFKEQLRFVEPFQSKRLLFNSFSPQRDPLADTSDLIKADIGVFNSLLGKSYGEIASESRSMHKSQGFGSARNRGPIIEYFKHIAGERAKQDIFDGVPLDFSKITGAKAFSKILNSVIKNYDASAPEKSVPALVNAYKVADGIQDEFLAEQLKEQLKNIIFNCSGLWFEAIAEKASGNPGEEVKISFNSLLRNNADARLQKIIYADVFDTVLNSALSRHKPLQIARQVKVPKDAGFSVPFWLKKEPSEGLWQIDDQQKIAQAKDEAPLEAEFHFDFGGGIVLSKKRPVVFKWVDPVEGELYRNFEIIPEVMVNFTKPVFFFRETDANTVSITIRAGKDNVKGQAGLVLPQGWRSEPKELEYNLQKKNEEITLRFKVITVLNIARNKPITVNAFAVSAGERFHSGITMINYKHIPYQTIIKSASAVLTPMQTEVPTQKIAYIKGADELYEYLQQLNMNVTVIDPEAMESFNPAAFGVIVVGIRAFNMHEKLKLLQPALLRFVENGGNLVVQYNTSNFTGTIDYSIGPYPFKITRNRVTDESAPVEFLAANHPILNSPNKITSSDFEGWVQERGLYFAGGYEDNYKAILSMQDPGEEKNGGALIVTEYGKGTFVYTGLSFFRQLPAGVPGAARLFINLISYRSDRR